MSDRPLTVRVNGRDRELAPGATLLELLAELGRDPRSVAIEHNGDIVRRPRYGEIELAPGDRVEVVHFVQGG